MFRVPIGIFVFLMVLPFAAFAADQAYQPGPDDILFINVTGHPELGSEEIHVSRTDELVHPIWGKVKIDGATIAELEDRIKKLLAEKYVADPEVSVNVLQANSLLVYLIANNGITSPYRLGINGNLSELLVRSAITPEACKRLMAVIMRRDEREVPVADGQPSKSISVPVQTTVDLYELMVNGRKEIDVPLRRNDWVRLINRDPDQVDSHVFLFGKSDVTFCKYQPEMTLAAAVQQTSAEEPPPAADRIHLRADGIFVWGDWPTKQGQISVSGKVQNPGTLDLKPGMTLGDALNSARLTDDAGSLARIVIIRRGEEIAKKCDFYLMNDKPDEGYGLTELLQSQDVIFVLNDGGQ